MVPFPVVPVVPLPAVPVVPFPVVLPVAPLPPLATSTAEVAEDFAVIVCVIVCQGTVSIKQGHRIKSTYAISCRSRACRETYGKQSKDQGLLGEHLD